MSTANTNTLPIIEPYLTFEGRCDEAIEFYKKALGAEVLMLMRFKDSPEPPSGDCGSTASPDSVMHATLKIGGSNVMLSDGRCSGQPKFDGISLSYSAPTVAEVERAYAALADGGQVCMPLTKTFFSPSFGMVADRFGVMWMVIVPQKM